ncbi:MAG: TIGR04086 family membrane protein [Lachnospiraceae bacterium]|nr:TIGR04086 family membrane protein [Lachnospiraceae bacterium]
MTQKLAVNTKLSFLLKNLFLSYLLTTILLLLLSLFLYRFSLSEKTVSMGITLIYVITTFLAGFLAGKKEQSRRFLWGLLMGFLYFIVLTVISVIIHKSFGGFGSDFFSTLAVCCASGMLGGMVS